jgi:hypothetical protein
MASIAEMYCNSVKRDSGLYFAAWSPEAKYRLGDVGILQNGKMFVQKTSLKDEGIEWEEEPDTSSGSFDLSSKQGTSVSLKISGEVNPSAPHLPKGSAGVVVSLGREASYVIRSNEVYEPRIRNMADVEREVMERFKARRWQKEWVIISQVVHCAKVDIIISKSANVKLEIKAKGDVPVGTTVNLGNVDVGFEIVNTSGAIFNFLDTKDASPLFQLVGIQRRFPFGHKIGSRDAREIDPRSPSAVPDEQVLQEADSLYLGTL